jgi:Flp pilus assembly pilin Flp
MLRLKKKKIKSLHGQSVLEYVLLVGIVTVVLVAMMQQVKRGAQSLVKGVADEIGNQQNSDQFKLWPNGEIDNRVGYLDSSNMTTSSANTKSVRERIGVINYNTDENQFTTTNTFTNMGFIEEM